MEFTIFSLIARTYNAVVSLSNFTSGLLSIGPKVSLQDGCLQSRSTWRAWVFGLGCFRKRVTVDPDANRVEVSKYLFWVFKSQRSIAFDEIRRIDYDCKSLPTSLNFINGADDEIERYIVSLELVDRDVVKLWSFVGEGSVNTGWGGVLLGGDSVYDLRGDQMEQSQAYIRLLQAMTGKSLT